MNFPDSERLELDALCNALIDGVATDRQRARLEEMLACSEEARRYYVRATALSASLFEYAGEMQTEMPDAPFVAPEHERPARGLWWALGSLAAAAAVIAGLWIAGVMTVPKGQELAAGGQENDEFVARVSGVKDCQWSGATLGDGEELRRGQRIKLVSGFAEVSFDSGAVVMLEGPATLEVTSEWDARLHQGTLRAVVPPEAIGFRISNPAVEVVDLGTEFNMVADASGATEVFVVKGAVEARSSQGSERAVVLRESQARRFAGAATSEVYDREQKFGRLARKVALERAVRPVGYVHWSFDEQNERSRAEVVGLPQREIFAQMEGGADVRTEGRWRQALQLDGQNFGRADLTAFPSAGPRTIAFWARIPADSQISDAGAMVSWSAAESVVPRGEIAWNRNPAQGAVGALRTQVGRGYVVGTTQLRDGQWHHVALVLRPVPRREKIQVKQYVDGRLESISARRGGFRRERQVAAAPPALWIGCSPGGAGERFRGALDELFLADQALTPQEIKNLIQHNRPTPEITLAAQ